MMASRRPTTTRPSLSFSESSSTKQHRRRSSSRRPTGSTKKNSPMDRPVVDHTYTDHYHDAEVTAIMDNSAKKNSRGGVTTPFPEKLHAMLSSGDLDVVVGWQPHGRAFLIRDKDVFVNKVMPKYFNQTKLTSFQRQLNLYGFVRLTAPGDDRGTYYHSLFLRGRPDLCHLMHRTRIKGNGMKAAASPNTEPSFYQMEFCYDDKTLQRQRQQPRFESEDYDDTKVEIGGSSFSEVVEKDEQVDEQEALPEVSQQEPTPIVSPSVSFDSTMPHFSISRNDSVVPFLDRSYTKFEDSLIPSSMSGIVPSKFDQGMSSGPLSLASLLSPPLMRSPALLQVEEDWGLPAQHDDDISACLSFPTNPDGETSDEEDDVDELMGMPDEDTPVDSTTKFNDLMVSSLMETQDEGSLLGSVPNSYWGQLASV